MTLFEKIERLEESIAPIKKQIEILEQQKTSKKRRKDKDGGYCEKCEEGWTRIPFPKEFIDEDSPDFMKRGRLAMCDCVGVSDINEKISRLYASTQEAEKEILLLESRRKSIAKKIGESYVDKSVHDFIKTGNEGSITKIVAWRTDGRKVPLAIIGKTGVGKTHLAAAVCNELALEGREFIYIEAYRIDDFTNAEIYPPYERAREVTRLSEVEVLIVDDISKSKMTDALYSHVWYPILHNRRKNSRVTVYTSDMLPNKLWENYAQLGAYQREQIEKLYTRIEWLTDGVREICIVPLKRREK